MPAHAPLAIRAARAVHAAGGVCRSADHRPEGCATQASQRFRPPMTFRSREEVIALIACEVLEIDMPNLLVRNLDEALVERLRKRAASNNRSVEAEHREILAEVLRHPKKLSFAQVLMSMPDVGIDADFERVHHENEGEGNRVFD
jgi:antitoxin FitA